MYGAFVGADATLDSIQQLNTQAVRPLATFLDRPSQPQLAEQCRAIKAAGLKLTLTIRPNGDYQVPSTPVDRTWYQDRLRTVLTELQPDLIAVGNEQAWSHYWGGTPAEYIAELQAACLVRDELATQGIVFAVMDGGMVYGAIAGLAIRHAYDLANTGVEKRQVVDFARSAFPDGWNGRAIVGYDGVGRIVESTRDELSTAQAILDGIRDVTPRPNFVNFHFYNGGTYALRHIVEYLQDWTGLIAVSNEVGTWKVDTAYLRSIMREADALGVDIYWNTFKANQGDRNEPLVDTNGRLNTLGRAFADVAKATYGSGPLTA